MAKEKVHRKLSRSWTAEEAGHILDEIKSSQMTDSAFARKRGLKIGRIAWWRKKLGRLRRTEEKSAIKPKPSRHAGEFVEFKALARPESDLRIEVMLRNGRSVLVPLGVHAAELALLLNAIEERPC